MLIRKVTIENYGCYCGQVEFDLMPRMKHHSDRPIILIGGNNGSGKTTLLDAIRLVLYGKSALGPRVSNAEYEAILLARVHRPKNFLFPVQKARIGLEFDYVSFGSKETIYVERGWSVEHPNGVKEYLRIQRDGKQLEGVTPEFWKGFIEELIPERLSQLFFLDGEKIESLASEDMGSSSLGDSIKTLLGLDIVEKLKADLGIYLSREAKKTASEHDQTTLEGLEKKMQVLSGELEKGRLKLASIRSGIDGVLAEIRKTENKLNAEGHIFSERKDELNIQRGKLIANIEEMERKIREACENTFPFALCPSVAANLLAQLSRERKFAAGKILVEEISEIENKLGLELSRREFNLEPGLLHDILNIFHNLIRRRIEQIPYTEKDQIIHGFSENEYQQVLGWLADATGNSLAALRKIGKDLEDLYSELRHLEKERMRVPQNLQLDPFFKLMSNLNLRLANLRQEESVLTEFLRVTERESNTLRRESEKLLELHKNRSAHQSRIRLAHRVRAALDSYYKELTALKVLQLENTVADCFNHLLRKQGLVKSFSVDSQTFAVSLHDESGKILPKETLSSGEKQIYAVAMLWGLAKTCGRLLPLIIDTPLARLDSEHRRNLVYQYFPFASHQVILLSTDTEIDQVLFDCLRPKISHCYVLSFDQLTGSTKPLNHYFWKERVDERADSPAYTIHN